MNALEAVSGFLRKVRELDTYGTRLYDVQYEESSCQFGISPGGVAIFRRNRRIVFQDWSVVNEVSFKNKKILIVISGSGVSTIGTATLFLTLISYVCVHGYPLPNDLYEPFTKLRLCCYRK